jgi:hypothetical protein
MAAVDPHESLPRLPGGATLEADGGTWLLRYSVQSYDYGERLPDMVDIAIPIVARDYEDALAMARLILSARSRLGEPRPSHIVTRFE